MRTETSKTSPSLRKLACERCGCEFECGVGGNCWCDAEPYRLPMPAGGGDCLCPKCLRIAADEQK